MTEGHASADAGDSPGAARQVSIRGDMIRLGQLLKHAGIVDGGGEAKELLLAGAVTVNGAPEARRGRQLHDGDLVLADGVELRVVAGGA